MDELEDYFRDLITHHKSVDIAEAEFKKNMAEDEELRQSYKEWCHMVGSSERMGFRDFCSEFIESQDMIWDSLKDYDEQY